MSRRARQSCPQLICILADHSNSMAGARAELTTDAIRELILRFQCTGPRGRDRSYYRLVLITWAAEPEIYPGCNMIPIRQLNADDVVLRGCGGPSDMAKALEFAYAGLSRYVSEVVEPHSTNSSHPLPAVIFFSDGLYYHTMRTFFHQRCAGRNSARSPDIGPKTRVSYGNVGKR